MSTRPRLPVEIRPAALTDAAAIADIYNEAILTTVATFDTDIKDAAERARWLEAHGETHPVLVAVAEDRAVGWASLTRWSDRKAYDLCAETSFYVFASHQGRGIGRALMTALMAESRRLGFRTLIARIAADSRESIHLHEQFGFAHAGTLRQVGWKFDRWLDVVMMQIVLTENEGQGGGAA
ncbi:MAG: N-acetyltransferase family protein [Verrucomicrobiota bacterium]